METRAELGMEAEPMAASVAVMATTITFPADRCRPFACAHHVDMLSALHRSISSLLFFLKRPLLESTDFVFIHLCTACAVLASACSQLHPGNGALTDARPLSAATCKHRNRTSQQQHSFDRKYLWQALFHSEMYIVLMS